MANLGRTTFSANGDLTFTAGADDTRISVSGDYGGGTLSFIDNDPNLGELTVDSWTSATTEQSQIFAFSKGTDVIIRLSGSTNPSLKVKAIPLCSTIR